MTTYYTDVHRHDQNTPLPRKKWSWNAITPPSPLPQERGSCPAVPPKLSYLTPHFIPKLIIPKSLLHSMTHPFPFSPKQQAMVLSALAKNRFPEELTKPSACWPPPHPFMNTSSENINLSVLQFLVEFSWLFNSYHTQHSSIIWTTSIITLMCSKFIYY